MVCNSSISDGRLFMEGETIDMQCNISYRGNLPPVMIWKKIGSDGKTQDQVMDVQGTSEHGVSVTSKLSIKLSSTHDRARFSCKTYFQQSNNAHVKDVPAYEYIWNSEMLNVSCW